MTVQTPERHIDREHGAKKRYVLIVLVAFVFLCILVWVSEFFDIPNLFLGAQKTPFNWQEALMETCIIITIGTISILLLYRSIKRHEQATERFTREKAFSHTLLQASPTFFVAIDPDGRAFMMNDEMLRELGYTRDEIIGRDYLATVIPPSEREAVVSIFETLARKKIGTVSENHVLTKDGRELLVEWHGRPFFKENGELYFIFGVGTDITNRKHAEEALKRSREQLRNLHKHAQDLRERERTRVAREIHDELGQVLTVLKMDLSFLVKKIPPEQTVLRGKISSMLASIETSIESVRRIIMDLRPSLLDHLGLIAAIEWQAQDFQNRTGIVCSLTAGTDEITLEPEVSTSIFRIFQEALTNIARHSGATVVDITIREEGDSLSMMVRDNGRGIHKKQIDNPHSYGLMGIRERIYFCGGSFSITGVKNRGTTLTITIPYTNERECDDTSIGS